jgi:hypothetical protein
MKNQVRCFLHTGAAWCFLLLLAMGCGKSSPAPATRTELLCNTWRATQVLVNGVPDNTLILSPFRLTFRQDATYSLTDLKGLTRQGTWQFTTDEGQILLDSGTAGEQAWEIIILNESRLEYTHHTANYKTGNLAVTFKLARLQ